MKKILLITTIALFGLYVQPAYSVGTSGAIETQYEDPGDITLVTGPSNDAGDATLEDSGITIVDGTQTDSGTADDSGDDTSSDDTSGDDTSGEDDSGGSTTLNINPGNGVEVEIGNAEDMTGQIEIADAYIGQVVENFSCEVKRTCAEYGFSQTLAQCLNAKLKECPFGNGQATSTYFCSTLPTTDPICDEGKVYIASDKSCRAYCPSDSTRQGTGCKCSDANKVYSDIANKCICKPSMVWNGSSCVDGVTACEAKDLGYATNSTSDDIPSPLVDGYNVVHGEGYCKTGTATTTCENLGMSSTPTSGYLCKKVTPTGTSLACYTDCKQNATCGGGYYGSNNVVYQSNTAHGIIHNGRYYQLRTTSGGTYSYTDVVNFDTSSEIPVAGAKYTLVNAGYGGNVAIWLKDDERKCPSGGQNYIVRNSESICTTNSIKMANAIVKLKDCGLIVESCEDYNMKQSITAGEICKKKTVSGTTLTCYDECYECKIGQVKNGAICSTVEDLSQSSDYVIVSISDDGLYYNLADMYSRTRWDTYSKDIAFLKEEISEHCAYVGSTELLTMDEYEALRNVDYEALFTEQAPSSECYLASDGIVGNRGERITNISNFKGRPEDLLGTEIGNLCGSNASGSFTINIGVVCKVSEKVN